MSNSANRIFLAQHGLALDKSVDPERPLSANGIEQTILIAKHLYSANLTISSIIHSGKLRASQTAEIFSSQLFGLPTSAIDGLSPNDDVEQFATQLTIDNALYIGHLPHLSKLVSYLVCGNNSADIISFQNSAIVCLDKHDTNYQVHSYITPNLFCLQSN